jgi:hypothetical protein
VHSVLGRHHPLPRQSTTPRRPPPPPLLQQPLSKQSVPVLSPLVQPTYLRPTLTPLQQLWSGRNQFTPPVNRLPSPPPPPPPVYPSHVTTSRQTSKPIHPFVEILNNMAAQFLQQQQETDNSFIYQ